jgi:DNA-binding MltR family transcriptional regulator
MRRPKHQPISEDEVERILNYCAAQSDREAAIVAGGLVEDRLGAAIKAHFVPIPDKGDTAKAVTASTLFEGYGPLATFNAKIDIGFALGIYGTVTRSDLHIVRKIRNDFAHTLEPITFTDQHIAQKCGQLQVAKARTEADPAFDQIQKTTPELTPRFRYLMLCVILSGLFRGLATFTRPLDRPRWP